MIDKSQEYAIIKLVIKQFRSIKFIQKERKLYASPECLLP